MIGGAAATGGGLVFTGDQHGNLYGIDVRTGKTVWKANLGLAFGSAPIVYSIDGTESPGGRNRRRRHDRGVGSRTDRGQAGRAQAGRNPDRVNVIHSLGSEV
jgi:hypothetical protein